MNAQNQIQCRAWAEGVSTRRAHTDVNARPELKSWVLESIVKTSMSVYESLASAGTVDARISLVVTYAHAQEASSRVQT